MYPVFVDTCSFVSTFATQEITPNMWQKESDPPSNQNMGATYSMKHGLFAARKRCHIGLQQQKVTSDEAYKQNCLVMGHFLRNLIYG